MGGNVYTDSDYSRAVKKHVSDPDSVTTRAEQKAYRTGLLDPQVDPAANDVIRLSKPRFIEIENMGYQLEFGIPMPVETRLDTTGSMGNNVDLAMEALPKLYTLCSQVLPNYELQLATGIFGDISDKFVLCRPKFASSADRLVERLTLMVPERAGGDTPEDPQYGLFGGAYLTNARISNYGLRGYDFTVSDAPARDYVDPRQLVRIFGENVFQKTSENGHSINKNDLPSTEEIVQDLLKRAHAFFIQVGNSSGTTSFWTRIFGQDRVIILDDIRLLPHVQSLIIGLTEGVLAISNADQFLQENGIKTTGKANDLVRAVAHIPVGAQVELLSSLSRPLPQKGDIFKQKTDTWPIECEAGSPKESSNTISQTEKIEWL